MTRRSRSTPTSRFSGQYAEDGKQVRRAAREAAGNRCVRCLHPFESGKHGRGEWSPCDIQCVHRGPVRLMLPHEADWLVMHEPDADARVYVSLYSKVEAQWRILTVHHFDGNKANDAWFNLLPLCQRCHLQIQGKVDPETPYFFEHSDWIKPYVAGFYALKYEGRSLSREETMARLDELLAHELRTAAAK